MRLWTIFNTVFVAFVAFMVLCFLFPALAPLWYVLAPVGVGVVLAQAIASIFAVAVLSATFLIK